MNVKLKNAWLITWIAPQNKEGLKIAAILSSRKSTGFVEDFTELLYLRSRHNASSMAYYANRPKERSKALRGYTGGITYGGSAPPWLYARRVTNLEIITDEENDKEVVSWVEPTEYKLNEQTRDLEVASEGRNERVERSWSTTLGEEPGGRY